ncbi:MAG: hypothetical protein ACLR7U_01120 [Ruthenibacterium lactatiformans]
MPIDKSIDYSAITPEIKALTKLCLADNVIDGNVCEVRCQPRR